MVLFEMEEPSDRQAVMGAEHVTSYYQQNDS